MSDEFIKIATKEINEEISELDKILSTCQNDSDVLANADKFEKSTHKIKGLAPMMGKEELGELSNQLDTLFKKMIEGRQVQGIFDTLTDSFGSIKNSMNEPESDLISITNKIKQILSNL